MGFATGWPRCAPQSSLRPRGSLRMPGRFPGSHCAWSSNWARAASERSGWVWDKTLFLYPCWCHVDLFRFTVCRKYEHKQPYLLCLLMSKLGNYPLPAVASAVSCIHSVSGDCLTQEDSHREIYLWTPDMYLLILGIDLQGVHAWQHLSQQF